MAKSCSMLLTSPKQSYGKRNTTRRFVILIRRYAISIKKSMNSYQNRSKTFHLTLRSSQFPLEEPREECRVRKAIAQITGSVLRLLVPRQIGRALFLGEIGR